MNIQPVYTCSHTHTQFFLEKEWLINATDIHVDTCLHLACSNTQREICMPRAVQDAAGSPLDPETRSSALVTVSAEPSEIAAKMCSYVTYQKWTVHLW